MLCSYCLPFLYYKQSVLLNRDYLFKNTEIVNKKLLSFHQQLPSSVKKMKEVQIEVPKNISFLMESVDKMKKRVIQIDKGIIIRDDKKGGYNGEV